MMKLLVLLTMGAIIAGSFAHSWDKDPERVKSDALHLVITIIAFVSIALLFSLRTGWWLR